MCPDSPNPDTDYVTFHLSISKVVQQTVEPLLRLNIRSRPSQPQYSQVVTPIVAQYPRGTAMPHELVDEDYRDEGNFSSTVFLDFTDGSPYWPPAEDTASSREARNGSYQRALTYYSATHSPSADSTGSPPFVENESETSSAFNSDQQASKGLAPPPPTRPPPKPPSSPDQSFKRPISEVQPGPEHPSHRASKG